MLPCRQSFDDDSRYEMWNFETPYLVTEEKASVVPITGDERSTSRSPNLFKGLIPDTTTMTGRDVVDLENIVKNWAKQIFEVTKTREEARINKKHLQVKT